ncbi:ABC transporter substrate-binding protein [Nocardia miyunensis]|uniref:ABC transporter substrate-binding protein n=1 Tax=Nocardia miyunensis TaxID=282684 RepID=UPI000833F634|nr:ABC transporter substrate-binding protein [Nocardia miyunensis]
MKPVNFKMGLTCRAARRLTTAVAAIVLASTGLVACGSGSDSAGTDGGLATVTFALDYMPGPAHNGLALAVENGIFARHGIKVNILPFTSAAPDGLVASGKADFALNWGATYALADFAQGLPVTAVYALYQHNPNILAVMKSSDITSPQGLGGRRLGTYGSANEEVMANTMISADGGTKKIVPVTVGNTLYQAMSSGKVDGALIYKSDEFYFRGGEASLRTWDALKYGVPDMYGNLVIANNSFLAAHADVAKKFLAAFTEAYNQTLADPAPGNAALTKLFPGKIDTAEVDYVSKYQSSYLFVDPKGTTGTMDMKVWRETLAYMVKNNLLADNDGKTLNGDIDLTKYVTNQYLPAS